MTESDELNPCQGTAPPSLSTSLREVSPGLLAKFECNNPGGSHKTRAARHILRAGVRSGSIIPGKTTIIEKTGGNFGFGLAACRHEFNVEIELAVGLNFSAIKRQYLKRLGVKLIGIDMLEKGVTPKEVVESHIEQAASLGKRYFHTNQFGNPSNLAAHEFETGAEIALQLSAWPDTERITFVACAGTGASAMGISRALTRAGHDVKLVLVEPAGNDSRNGVFLSHQLEGMSVGVCPPFIDWSSVSETQTVSHDTMIHTQMEFARKTGYVVGNTSAACLAVAQRLIPAPRGHKVLFIVYDHGHWYL